MKFNTIEVTTTPLLN